LELPSLLQVGYRAFDKIRECWIRIRSSVQIKLFGIDRRFFRPGKQARADSTYALLYPVPFRFGVRVIAARVHHVFIIAVSSEELSVKPKQSFGLVDDALLPALFFQISYVSVTKLSEGTLYEPKRRLFVPCLPLSFWRRAQNLTRLPPVLKVVILFVTFHMFFTTCSATLRLDLIPATLEQVSLHCVIIW
jgi:hypothetical protein